MPLESKYLRHECSFKHQLNMNHTVIFILFSIFITKSQCNDISDYVSSTQTEELPSSPPQPSPYALSPTYLTYLAESEVQIYEEMTKYARGMEERLELIRAYLKDYEESSLRLTADLSEATEPSEKVVSNPIAAYRMMRRFSRDFDTIKKHLSKGFEEALKHSLDQLSAENNLPSENDLRDAMDAILRVNYVYDMDINEFSKGKIMGQETNVEFTTSQTYEIAEYATKQKQYNLALSWLQETELRLNEADDDESLTLSMTDLDKTYKEIITNHDLDFDKNTNPLFMFTEKLSENPNAPTFRKNGSMEDDYFNFLALCNGANFQTPKYKATLKCWYHRMNPYFYLFPLKAELLHHDPLLIQFHDIISPTWIEEMKQKAIPTLKRPPPISPGATIRTVVNAWLGDEDIPNVQLARRMELITNLHVKGKNSSTDLQIAGYAYGSHVALHVDVFRNTENTPSFFETGNLLNTFLIYLNDVEQGGLTAFPLLGTHVKPSMGSAVLWFNSLRNGNADEVMVHGACPVVLGHKWIATKWTHLNDNFLKWPCRLNAQV